MHPLLPVKGILSVKYLTNVPIDEFKRFALPANDNYMRNTDIYKILYTSVKSLGVLDPVLCYDIAFVDLNNKPLYLNRKLHGAYLMRGNIRWLVCKDLGITTLNAVVVKVDYGHTTGDLFTGTSFHFSEETDFTKELDLTDRVNACFPSYNPSCYLKGFYLDMVVPSLREVEAFGVTDYDAVLDDFKDELSVIDYVPSQLEVESFIVRLG